MPKPARTPQDIRDDLVRGLSRAKGAIVANQLRDLREVLEPSELTDYLGAEYPDELLFGPLPDGVKLVLDPDTGRTHEERIDTNVFVQREKLLERLRRTDWRPPARETVKLPPAKPAANKAA